MCVPLTKVFLFSKLPNLFTYFCCLCCVVRPNTCALERNKTVPDDYGHIVHIPALQYHSFLDTGDIPPHKPAFLTFLWPSGCGGWSSLTF